MGLYQNIVLFSQKFFLYPTGGGKKKKKKEGIQHSKEEKKNYNIQVSQWFVFSDTIDSNRSMGQKEKNAKHIGVKFCLF